MIALRRLLDVSPPNELCEEWLLAGKEYASSALTAAFFVVVRKGVKAKLCENSWKKMLKCE